MTRDFDTNLGLFSFAPNGEAISEPGMLIVSDAIKEMRDTAIAPQCRCGIDSMDEGDVGFSTEQRKAILEQGLKLLEGAVDRAGEPTVQ